ncbi:MAG: gamma-glutamylcyclotransferase [Albidovulum sp.]
MQWIFGYGSLIWDPGFGFAERQIARLDGWQRSFCMKSIHYRGTHENPGLVLALDRAEGGYCDGVAFGVCDAAAPAVLDYLRARELISYAYVEAQLPIRLADGRAVDSVTFVINRDHSQYAGLLSREDQAQIIAKCHGDKGPNAEYLWNTSAHLTGLGLADPEMAWLADRVRMIVKQQGAASG